MKNAITLILLFFGIHVIGQDSIHIKSHKILTFEPNWGGEGLKVYSQIPNVDDIKVSSWYFNPRIGIFLCKNTEFGISGTYIKVKSNIPTVKSGKAYSLGYFVRYHLNFFNFWQGTNSKGNKYTLSGKPFMEIGNEFSSFAQDSMKNHYFATSLSSRRFNTKLGVNFKLYKNLYFSIGLIHSYNPDYFFKRSKLGIFTTLGYTFIKKNKE